VRPAETYAEAIWRIAGETVNYLIDTVNNLIETVFPHEPLPPVLRPSGESTPLPADLANKLYAQLEQERARLLEGARFFFF
jgi:hypothetical protein